MLTKIFALIFITFALSRAILRFNDKSIKIGEFFLWTIVWLTATVLILSPNVSDIIADILGVKRGADSIFFISTIILFYLLFRLYVKIDRIDKDLTDFVVKISKLNNKNNKQS
jgi:hypothetical protein